MKKTLAELTKKVGGRTHQMGDFLVVEDPEKVGTWHLPVKANGTPDRRLAAAAWAALFSPGGYRGNKYEGPKMDEAKAKLKALYKSQDWEMPVSERDLAYEITLAESYYDEYSRAMPYVPLSVTSFSDLETLEDAKRKGQAISRRIEQFQAMIYNIWNSEVADKVAAWESLFAEFIDIMNVELSSPTIMEMAESSVGSIVSVNLSESETQTQENGNGNKPLYLKVRLIRPGKGNANDRNFYPGWMLEKYAPLKFPGVKMHVTDHKDEERSVRTEVSQIIGIDSFDEDGAPIANVVTLEPQFAEMVRHRAQAGKLETLECSIYGSGKAVPKVIDGEEWKEVQEFDEIYFVDWVTRAGAGGKALSITELQESEKVKKDKTEQDHEQEQPIAEADADGNALPVNISEDDRQPEEETSQETPQETPIADESQQEENPEPASVPASEQGFLSPGDVLQAIDDYPQPVPAAMRERLAALRYIRVEDVHSTIQAEFAYLSQISGFGKPFGMGDNADVAETETVQPANLSEMASDINAVWGFGRKKQK